MSLLAVDRALRAKLRGVPVDRQGNSVAGLGLRIPNLKKGNNSSNEDGTWAVEFTGISSQVRIFKGKSKGREWENVFPSLVYRFLGMEYDAGQSPFGITARSNTSGSANVLDAYGNIVATGQQINIMQKVPVSYTYRYQFELYGENDVELALLAESFILLFPAHGGLTYQQLDGSFVTVDMVLENSTTVPDLSAVIGEEMTGFMTFTYRVEAFQDTTKMLTNVTAITQTVLETQKIENIDPQARVRTIQLDDQPLEDD